MNISSTISYTLYALHISLSSLSASGRQPAHSEKMNYVFIISICVTDHIKLFFYSSFVQSMCLVVASCAVVCVKYDNMTN